jgi:hypothetical protein
MAWPGLACNVSWSLLPYMTVTERASVTSASPPPAWFEFTGRLALWAGHFLGRQSPQPA